MISAPGGRLCHQGAGRMPAQAILSASMAVRVRLTRVGSKKNPIWRVVVADQRSPRDGRFIETIGHYNPQTEPSTIRIDEERLQHWLARGAQPSGSVKQLVKAYSKSGGAGDPGVTQPAEDPAPAPADVGEGHPESAAPGEPAPGAGEEIEAPAPGTPGAPEEEAEAAEAAADAEDQAAAQDSD
jgi:small subunit ribosomal protein S16